MRIRGEGDGTPMIDNFSILLSHVLLAIALWRLMNRPDLDHEDPPVQDEKPTGFGQRNRPVSNIRKAVPDA
jgi:hypothetical protein